jgi:LysR family glycine cleavage system transcriptional activator
MQKAMPTPPIQYLPAFVAAARLGSFQAAAGQLHVTPSAISQQIKSLESRIGLALFRRQGKTLQLTQAGEQFLSFAAQTLNTYQQGWDDFAGQFLGNTLRVSMTSYMANRIIIPRLAELKRDTGLTLEIFSSSYHQDLQARHLDAAIRFGSPPWPQHEATLLAAATTALVARPEVFARHPIRQRQDWQHHTLLHARRSVNDWQQLEQRLGYPLNAAGELFFDSYEAAIEAAAAGLGVAIASFPMSEQELRTGRLQARSQRRYPSAEGFYLVCKPNDYKQRDYALLRDWLLRLFASL